jgi:hypothetical protein
MDRLNAFAIIDCISYVAVIVLKVHTCDGVEM